MEIQALCRDFNLRVASERNITSPVYIIHINKISDIWIKRYIKTKAKRLNEALTKVKHLIFAIVKNVGMTASVKIIAVLPAFCPYGKQFKKLEK